MYSWTSSWPYFTGTERIAENYLFVFQKSVKKQTNWETATKPSAGIWYTMEKKEIVHFYVSGDEFFKPFLYKTSRATPEHPLVWINMLKMAKYFFLS